MRLVVPSSRSATGQVDALLVAVARESASRPPVTVAARADLIEAARFHRLAPLVHVAHRGSEPEVADLFREDRRRAMTTHLRACAVLEQLGTILDGIPWATFKGPVYSEHAHPVPGLRTYNDLDVVVDPSRLREVSRLLLLAGWQVADYEDMLRNQSVPGEMHWISSPGVFVDLHWSMINMAERRRLFQVSVADLLERRVPVKLGTLHSWTLEPVDALVHACLHAALSGANKLIYLVDVDRLGQRITDWDDVAVRAKEWQAQAQVALVLARTQHVLGSPFPEDLWARLGVPRSLQVMSALTDQMAPVARGRTNQGLNKFVARVVRPSGPATLAAGASNAAKWLRDRPPGRAVESRERVRADEASLGAFLTAVESAAGDPELARPRPD